MRYVRLGLLLVLLATNGAWIWTQVTAHHYGYQAALGLPMKTLHLLRWEYRLYHPWQALVWQWQWGARWPLYVSVGSLVFSIATLIIAIRAHRCLHAMGPPPMTGHGTTTWATSKTIKQSGLYE